MACATPARCGVAAREVDHAERHVAGEDRHARSHGCAPAPRPSGAATRRACSASANGSRRSNAKRRCRPGRDAAGDLRGLDRDRAGAAAGVEQRAAVLGRPRQPAAASIAAASVSFSGASPLSLAPAALEQRLAGACRHTASRARRRGAARSGRSGWRVSTLGRSPVASRSTSQTASLMRSAAKFRLLQRRALRGDVDAQRLLRRDPVATSDAAGQLVEVVLVRGTGPSATSTARAARDGSRG